MQFWEQILVGAIAVLILFMVAPGIKGAMQKSKNAQEKHWGTIIMLTAVLIAFVFLLIWSVR